jgi:NADPH-dependent 2,4-dienoyl-CoA reductase/sulfur reductase-like enzyme
MGRKRVVVVGGVAGGASCAARLRRLDEDAEIVIFDRGHFASFANCGLPYYVGDVISDEARLLVATPELFRTRFNIQVHTQAEVTSIDRDSQTIKVKNLKTGDTRSEPYDVLVLAPGAAPIRPPLPGIDRDGVFTVRTIPDSRRIREWIERTGARNTVIIGAGFIGLEMAENLVKRGLTVTIVEATDQVMPPMDREMAEYVSRHLQKNGVHLHLSDPVAAFQGADKCVTSVITRSGAALPADMVILAIGVKPEIALAKSCGLEIGPRGGIRVNDAMQTSDPQIWAVGDAVEVLDYVTGDSCVIPLAAILISVVVLRSAASIVWTSVHTLLEATPAGVDLEVLVGGPVQSPSRHSVPSCARLGGWARPMGAHSTYAPADDVSARRGSACRGSAAAPAGGVEDRACNPRKRSGRLRERGSTRRMDLR